MRLSLGAPDTSGVMGMGMSAHWKEIHTQPLATSVIPIHSSNDSKLLFSSAVTRRGRKCARLSSYKPQIVPVAKPVRISEHYALGKTRCTCKYNIFDSNTRYSK